MLLLLADSSPLANEIYRSEMARPAYIMFSQAVSVDQSNNGISFFSVIEGVGVAPFVPGEAAPDNATLGINARLAVCWMREAEDTSDVVFETDINCASERGEQVFTGPIQRFSFLPNSYFQRVLTANLRIPGFPSLGMYFIESRLRRLGETEWATRQTFPFHVGELPPPPPAPLG
jgi:hypothetical protein